HLLVRGHVDRGARPRVGNSRPRTRRDHSRGSRSQRFDTLRKRHDDVRDRRGQPGTGRVARRDLSESLTALPHGRGCDRSEGRGEGKARLSRVGFGLVALLSVTTAAAGQRPGVSPDTPWSCPASHPIKGYVSSESGRRVYYMPGGPFYEEASPERCYATEDEARRDGSLPAREPRMPQPSDDHARRGRMVIPDDVAMRLRP